MPGDTTNPVGTIQLTHSTSLMFSVQPWKGRMFAHVRKFVSGPKYEGPTKSGLAMGGNVLLPVIDALTRLTAEVSGPKETQFAKIHKGGNTDVVVTVIPPDDLKSLPSVDVREYVTTDNYTGPTKKGVRFAWDKLTEVIAILQTQARHLGSVEKEQAVLFPEARAEWVGQVDQRDEHKTPARDRVLHELLPDGPKDFPGMFVASNASTVALELPSEPVSVVVSPDGGYAVQSDFGFHHDVRNPTEGNFLYYAHLRGHRKVVIPTAMIDVFRAVKAYENYLRDLRHALLQAYERKSGHKPIAEYHTGEVFKSYGLPWVE